MKKAEEIKRKLTQCKPELKSGFQVKEIGIFGSYVRNEQKKNSDLDILVDFEETPSLFKFMELESYLKTILKVKVDLVMKSVLKPRIGRRILNEVVYA
ncbi:MAG: nucleotidyltransferase family protein [Actinobacteria bacterium]|nr:nucleotidyltransferase family protein [Actinomycetota bacterium]MCG2680393.1 nucleotidyltransferase family protein [Kiritimatiellia bacterium]